MFRYVAIAWDDTSAPQASAAQRLGDAVGARVGWSAALDAAGLRVYVAGALPGRNGVHVLPGHRGLVLGKLFRRAELQHAVSSDPRLTPDEGDRIVQTEGRALLSDFWGRYVALLITASGETVVLRDPTGALPCYCTRHDGVGIAFSWLEDLLGAWRDWPLPAIDWNHLGAYLLLGRLAGTETALRGVLHVPAGSSVSLATDAPRPAMLWDAIGIARDVADEPAESAAVRLRQDVRTCARAWAACYDTILLRLSGGVDSAILLSCLDGAGLSDRVTCLNYHAVGSDSDERAFARLAAARAARPLIERRCDPEHPLQDLLDDALTPVPENHVGRMSMARMDAEVAAMQGATALFTGGGGDQLFFELRCTWPGADYLQIHGIDSGLLSAIADAARLGRVSLWQAAWQAMRDRWRPADPNEAAGKQRMLVTDALRSTVFDPGRLVHPALQTRTGLPIGKLRQLHELLSPAGYYDPGLREAAPEIVNPLLSQPVMDLCLALPTYLLTRGGRGRALARRAFAGDIPPQIATRRTKGGLDEHVATVLQNHLGFARALLLDGQLTRHGLLDRRRLEHSLSGRPSAQVAGFGELHHCIATEAWLHRWSQWQHRRTA